MWFGGLASRDLKFRDQESRFGYALTQNNLSLFKFPLPLSMCYGCPIMKTLQVLIALFAFAFLPLHAASLADLTWTTTLGEVTITDCDTAATGELIIPDTIEGNPVTSIGTFAFDSCSSLTAVTFLGDAPKIENDAFKKSSPTIYRKADAKGWGDTLAGRPVKLITEKP